MSQWKTPLVRQTFLVSSVIMCAVGQGMGTGYISCLLPALRQEESSIRLTLSEESWLASSYATCVMGIIFACGTMDPFGRRMIYLISTIPVVLGWAATYVATEYYALLVGRCLIGITAGAIGTIGPAAVGEYTSPKYRGFFLNIKNVGICLGSTIVHILENFFHWKTIALISMAPYVVSFAIALTWPESPYWLAWKGKFDSSEKVFFRLRGISEDTKWEYKELIKAQTQQTRTNANCFANITELLRKFKQKDFLKPLLIASVTMILFEACGKHIFPAYALQIIAGVLNSKSEPYYQTLCFDLVITSSAMFSSVLVKTMKRRAVLFATGFATVIFLFLACLYLFLVSKEILPNDRPWIGIALFVLYFIMANLGCTTMPIVLLGEMFPLKHKAAAMVCSGMLLSISMLITLQITPHMLLEFKVYGTFMIFGIITLISLLLLYFILPETKDRTLQEIEDYFNNGRFDDVKKNSDEEQIKMIRYHK